MIHAVSVVVYRGQAYIPTTARIEGEMAGAYMQIEPVYTSDLTVSGIAPILEELAEQGNPTMPTPSRETLRAYGGGPMLKAAGVRSWKTLAKGGASYGIYWLENEVRLYVSKLDEKGRFVDDPAKTRHFPPGVHIRTIVEAVLEDVRSRPELRPQEVRHA